MRALLALLLLATGCGNKAPAAPDPKQFATLDWEGKCAATLPRAKKCQDELVAQQLEDVMAPGASAADKKATAELTNELRNEQSFSDDAESLHRSNCRASDGYTAAVVACWAEPDCKSFAACVIAKDTWRPANAPSPTTPSPSGKAP